ncbi:alpha-N-arabinofuranosidase [Streptomyces sp. A7024]|uniref:non-reducing end alpha-L-arabinofuranosidase n=1 Tax=Streptomyces coryli TaxID=1128680 RepID=A0A6G4TTG8_9ACTN|nr:alpha-N-arabinofuranosidase [Streptomyces coryli]
MIEVDTRHPAGRIERDIYGHFLESAFFGNIEGGVFDDGSPLSDGGPGVRAGFRQDVLALCRELGIPNVRWPGGNFTSPYHWEDGIGDRDARPRRLELAWGSEESNRFGTDEFLAWCADVGAEPFLVHGCRSVDDAVRWVEYTNYAGDTAYTRRRKDNGHPDPYRVRYWGVGNEPYGPWQMGHRPAAEYAAAAREHARFMRLVDPEIKLVACGSPWQQEEWTRPVLQQTGRLIDYLSLHLYGAATHSYTGRHGDDDYEAVVAQPVYFEQRIEEYAHLVAELSAEAGLERPPALALDEWNIRHLEPAEWPEPCPGPDGGTGVRELPEGAPADGARGLRVNRYSPRTLADALFYAGVFHTLHRSSALPAPVTMANTVNLVNANGLIVARPNGAVKSASYHVWDLYQNHTGPVALPTTVEGPARTAAVRQGDNRGPGGDFATRLGVVPHLDASAMLSADGRRLHVAVVNRHRDAAVSARVVRDGDPGGLPAVAEVRDLGVEVDDMLAANSLSDPDRVAVRHRRAVETPGGCYAFPAHSVTVLAFDLD